MTEISFHRRTWQKMNWLLLVLSPNPQSPADPTLARTQTPPGSEVDVFLLSAARTQALVCKYAPILSNLETSSLLLNSPQPPTATHTPGFCPVSRASGSLGVLTLLVLKAMQSTFYRQPSSTQSALSEVIDNSFPSILPPDSATPHPPQTTSLCLLETLSALPGLDPTPQASPC